MSSKCRKSAYACFCCFSKGEVPPEPIKPQPKPPIDPDPIVVDPIPAEQNEKNITTLLEQTIQSISVLNRVLANYQRDQKNYDHNNNQIQTELSIETDEIIQRKLNLFEAHFAEFKQLTLLVHQSSSDETHSDNITITQSNSDPSGGSLQTKKINPIIVQEIRNLLGDVPNSEKKKRFYSTNGIYSEPFKIVPMKKKAQTEPIISLNIKEDASSIINLVQDNETKNQPEPYWLTYYSVNDIPKQLRTLESKEQPLGYLVNEQYGKIYRATYEGQTVVVKLINLKCAFNWEKLTYHTYIPLEVTLMKKVLKSQHCIQIIDWAVDDKNVKIIMESFEDVCDLRSLINGLNGVPEFLNKIIFEKIVQACLEIKERQVLHLDIKPENVLIVLGQKELIVKIIDFGSALHYTNETLTNLFTTPQIKPIEFLQQRKCNGDEATVWAIGISLYYASYTRLPTPNPEAIATTNVKYSNDDIYQQRNDLIRKCLTIVPSERIRLEDILKHSWFQTVSDFKCIHKNYSDLENNFKEYGLNNLTQIDKKIVACNKINKENFKPTEVDTMLKCKDIDGCAKLIDFVINDGSIYLIMEPLEDYIYISNHKISDENELKNYFKQILKICIEMREKNVLFIEFDRKRILVNTKTNMIKLFDFQKVLFISDDNSDAELSQLRSLGFFIDGLYSDRNLSVSDNLKDLIKALTKVKIKFEDISEQPWLKN